MQRDQSSGPLANLALLILAAVAAAVAGAFVLPWFSWSEPGGELLARYAPLEHGGARLVVEYDAAGSATSWSSQNDVLLPPGIALSAEMRKAERDAIQSFFRRPGETGELETQELIRRMRDAALYRTTNRKLAADGKITDSTTLAIRNAEADYLVAIYDAADESATTFEPPIPILSANLTVGHSWRATGGRRSGGSAVDYHYEAKVVEQPANDTLQVEARITFTSGGETMHDALLTHTLVAGRGVVESRTSTPAGELQNRHVLVSTGDQQLQEVAFPVVSIRTNPEPPGVSPNEWELTRFASTRGATDTSESSIPPTFISAEQPLLLAARYGGPLMAFAANDPGAPAVWRFETGATIYGRPAFDAQRGRIFFGAADKHLYALDVRGLFLWSFQTGDNVVTQPLVAGERVIFGSEDRSVRALHADTGALLWEKRLGGPVVSSPVLLSGRAIFGCDDGGVYAFDVATGEQRWRFEAEAPVEAPLVLADDVVFAGTHEGKLFALRDGAQLWAANIGGALRTAPAIGGELLFLVDGSGRLAAHEVANGRRVWLSAEEDYVGPPVIAGEVLIVGSTNGDVHAVSFTGARVQTWPAANASSPADGAAALRIGGAAGGGAVWFADARSVVRRLGAKIEGPVALRASWLLPFTHDALARNFLTVTPVAYHNQVLLIDSSREVFLLDPAAGKPQRLGAFGEARSVTIDPVVNGDTLLAIAGTTLHAVRLPAAELQWKYDPGEAGVQPPTVVGETVLWLTQRFGEKLPVGTLHALDLRTGALRWKRDALRGFMGAGAVLAHGDTIYTSAPAAAWSLTSGEPKWQLQTTALGAGGAALHPAGDLLFVGLMDEQSGAASIAAVRTSDGTIAWQREIGSSPLNPLERPSLTGEILVVPLWSGEVLGLSAADGAERWRYKPAKSRYGGITVAGDQVWLMESNARLVRLEASSGRMTGQLALDIDVANVQPFAQRPLVLGDHVVAPLGIALLGVPANEPQPEKQP